MLGILFAIIGYSIFCMKKDSDHPAWYQHPWTLFWTLPFSIHQKLKAPTVWDLAEVPDKTSVEICKTQKPLHFLAGLGHQPFHHCFNLCWVRSQLPLFHKKQRKETVGAWNSHFSALTKSRATSVLHVSDVLHGSCERSEYWHNITFTELSVLPSLVEQSSADFYPITPLNTTAQDGRWLEAAGWKIRRRCAGLSVKVLPGQRSLSSRSSWSVNFRKQTSGEEKNRNAHTKT